MLFVPFLAFLVSLGLYLPVNAEAGSLLFAPFEMARMFAAQNKLEISHLELARRIYLNDSKFLQTLRMDLIMLVYFIFFQFGITSIGIFPLDLNYYGKNILICTFLGGIGIFSLVLGTLFIQPVAYADIFNFYLVFNFVLVIFAVITLQKILYVKNKILRFTIILLILFMTLPRFIYKTSTVRAYIDPMPQISKTEIDAMKFVKYTTNSDDIVLVLNKGILDSFYPYVSIFTNREMFLSGQTMLTRHGIQYNERTKIVNSIVNETNPLILYEILKSNNIDIVYTYKGGQNIRVLSPKLKKIFENNAVQIFKVIK